MNSFLIYGARPRDLATRHLVPFLRDLCRTGTLQTAGLSVASIGSFLSDDAEGSRQIKRLLEFLRRKNRIVECQDLKGAICTVGSLACQIEHDNADYYLVTTTKPKVDSAKILEVKSLRDYIVSAWPDLLQEDDLSFDRDSPKSEWEDRIWTKVLRHAKVVDIVDWALGDYWLSNDRYERTLEWLAEVIARFDRVKETRLVTDASDEGNRKSLAAWCAKNRVRLVNEGRRGLHMRVFKTNQFELQIEAGFARVERSGLVSPCNVFILSGERALVR